jgi:excinuclease ABC subunit A
LNGKQIRLRNVRVHNLKNISLDIPHGQCVVICGLSGSGKSSLAFDTLYAEGQRRYLECLSPSARRFLVKLDKPDADLIDGLPPSIAVQPAREAADRTQSVGNATDVIEFLRILFSRVSEIVCPTCQIPVQAAHAQTISLWLQSLPAETRFMIAYDVAAEDGKTIYNALLLARRNGFSRAIIGSQTIGLDRFSKEDLQRWLSANEADGKPKPQEKKLVAIVVDRLVSGADDSSRTRESLETAIQFGLGRCLVLTAAGLSEHISSPKICQRVHIDNRLFEVHSFATHPICPRCHRTFSPAEPRLFNFNQFSTACKGCAGSGFADAEFRTPCSLCQGNRLPDDALAYRIDGMRIADFCDMPLEQLKDSLMNVAWTSDAEKIAKPLLAQVLVRLNYLESVGLGYLSLGRPLQTISNGEAQRLQLTSCLGSALINMLYVLDEPSAGLHPHDLGKILKAIDAIREKHNTLVIVDHHPTIISAAERIIEIGPGAGAEGGQVVFDGPYQALRTSATCTGEFLSGNRGLIFERNSRNNRGKKIQLFQASGNNLKSVDVDFPLGCLCLVTGVSGAGKSSLVSQTLYPALQNQLTKSKEFRPLPFEDLMGWENIDEVILIDASPVGRSGRSNPVIYVKAFDEIRQAFAETSDAKLRQATPGHFSFNVPGGRCEKCEGDGFLRFDMQFLSDVVVTCDECNGTRYRDSTLQIKYRGLSIADVLNMTAREAFAFFRGQPKVQAKLKALIDVGLDYLRIGQPANTLSGGESQRLKLALYLNASRRQRTLFILEEPSRGLHPADVTRLLDSFDLLITVGHSFVVVEHNCQVIQNADWVIDLGPGAAEKGGRVVAVGTPQEIAANERSLTGNYLFKEPF